MTTPKFMELAISEAFKGMRGNEGGPFGAVVVRKGDIIATAHNEVLKTNDPTAHAEVMAIRRASALLGRFDLSDCEIYSSCEPCPMCLAAIHWAKIPRLYYGCTRKDAARIGFDDEFLYEMINGTASVEKLQKIQQARDACLVPLREWEKKEDKRLY